MDHISTLYVHIPFCPTKCEYCAFVTRVGSLKLLEPYVEAVRTEARRWLLDGRTIPLTSVYFGGGTPALMEPEHLKRLLGTLRGLVGLEPGCEVSLEAHPGVVDLSRLRAFREAGANRLSFGAESLQPQELAALGRTHLADDVRARVRDARRAGFDNINLDFMYGLPTQTILSWADTLDQALALLPDHLSLYPLSLEPRTVFASRQARGTLSLPDEEEGLEMYHLACDRLRCAGYEHYEVANWARPGHQCHHNLAVWHNHECHALGVGAHRYVWPQRSSNVTSTTRYIRSMVNGEPVVVDAETIDARTALNETVMLRLRLLQEGLDLSEVGERFGVDLQQRWARPLQRLNHAGLIDVHQGRVHLRETAVPVANAVWSELLL